MKMGSRLLTAGILGMFMASQVMAAPDLGTYAFGADKQKKDAVERKMNKAQADKAELDKETKTKQEKRNALLGVVDPEKVREELSQIQSDATQKALEVQQLTKKLSSARETGRLQGKQIDELQATVEQLVQQNKMLQEMIESGKDPGQDPRQVRHSHQQLHG
ncbi:MAG: hypothetical protein HY814_03080 [Candidatus Riflebacteria bacterium]|nr:hypothetical protein [Candidatus Riflebacteria bacterium]